GQGEHPVDDWGAVERSRGAAAAGDYGRGGVVDVLPPRSDVLGHLLGDDLACDRVSERLLGALGGGASVDVEGEQGGAGGGPSGPRFGFGGGGHFCSWVWRICSVRAWATAGCRGRGGSGRGPRSAWRRRRRRGCRGLPDGCRSRWHRSGGGRWLRRAAARGWAGRRRGVRCAAVSNRCEPPDPGRRS